MSPSPRFRDSVLLLVAVVALASAVLFIQLSTVPPALLTAWRLTLAGGLLLPLAVWEWKQVRATTGRVPLSLAVLPGLVFAAHLISWVVGARRTPTANASLIANMAPLVLPGLLYILVRERVSRREWLGTGVALLGLVILVSGDVHLSRETAMGDLICFGSMIFLAVYLALARQRSPQFPGFALYIVPLYFCGAMASWGVVGISGQAWWPERSQWPWVLALAVIPTVGGHGLLNYSMKRFRGQVVAVASQTQFVFAGTAAYFLFDAIPSLTFYPACLLALTGTFFVLRR